MRISCLGASGSTPRATRARRPASPSSWANPSSPAGTPLATRCSASRVCAARSSRTFYRVTTCATCSTGTVAPTASTAPGATTSSTAAPATIGCSAATVPTSSAVAPGRISPTTACPTQAVRVDLATGKGFGGDATGDRLFGVEGVEGSELNDRISGNGAANRLIGNTGADLLSGAGGADRFVYPTPPTAPAPMATASSTSAGRRATASTSPASTPTSCPAATRHSASSALGEFTGAGQLRFLHGHGGTGDPGQHDRRSPRCGAGNRADLAALVAGGRFPD